MGESAQGANDERKKITSAKNNGLVENAALATEKRTTAKITRAQPLHLQPKAAATTSVRYH